MAATTFSDSFFPVKWIGFLGVIRPIIMQNENGPCPLLAIANVASLVQRITLQVGTQVITGDELVEHVARYLIAHAEKQVEEGTLDRVHAEAVVNELVPLLPSMMEGLDVDPIFTGVKKFECTRQTELFQLAQISLMHGWVVNKELEPAAVAAFGNLAYNEALDLIIAATGSPAVVRPKSSGRSSSSPRPGSGMFVPGLPLPSQECLLPGGAAAMPQVAHTPLRVAGEPAASVGMPSLALPQPVEAVSLASPASMMTALAMRDGETEGEVIVTPLRAIDERKEEGEGKETEAESQAADSKTEEESKEGMASDNVVEHAPTATPAVPPPAADVIARAKVMDEWLSQYGSQLTGAGIQQLRTTLRHLELAVFFRNNHFSVIFRSEARLFCLVTDVGFFETPDVVWEEIDERSVSGDTVYVDSLFRGPPLLSAGVAHAEMVRHGGQGGSDHEHDDEALARRLQQEYEQHDDEGVGDEEAQDMAAALQASRAEPNLGGSISRGRPMTVVRMPGTIAPAHVTAASSSTSATAASDAIPDIVPEDMVGDYLALSTADRANLVAMLEEGSTSARGEDINGEGNAPGQGNAPQQAPGQSRTVLGIRGEREAAAAAAPAIIPGRNDRSAQQAAQLRSLHHERIAREGAPQPSQARSGGGAPSSRPAEGSGVGASSSRGSESKARDSGCVLQ